MSTPVIALIVMAEIAILYLLTVKPEQKRARAFLVNKSTESLPEFAKWPHAETSRKHLRR